VGYSDWALYRDLLLRAVRAHLPTAELDAAATAARAWHEAGPEAWERSRAINELLAPLASDRPKILLFAGYPGCAEFLRVHLASQFGDDAVASFRAEQTMEQKEALALRFQQDPRRVAPRLRRVRRRGA
jgi:hypothetical protein